VALVNSTTHTSKET